MTQFNIRDHIEFDSKGRAQCPVCLQDGKAGKNLSVMESGAYKCFRSCTPDQIREVIGAQRDRTLPPPSSPPSPPPKNVLLNPQKVRAATNHLLQKGVVSLDWLDQRGINKEMIRHYRLGYARARVGDSGRKNGFTHLPCVAIAIPNHDGTAYFHKKRVRPWEAKEKQPDGYQAWSQYGIPAMVYTTHQPAAAKTTWLCEGEWDAIVLGWAVRNSELKNNVQVSCFTCGAGNVPPDDELAKLTGDVIAFYDLDDAGAAGVEKVGKRIGDRLKVGTVPSLENPSKGWDITDAIQVGLFPQICEAATAATPWEAPKKPNPLRDRLVTNDELLARAPDYTDWLVDDLLTSDELFLLAASPRAGKSLLAFTLAQAVATGGRFLGRPVAQGAVIYVRAEDSETKTKERQGKQGWAEGMPVYWLDKFKLNELEHLEELIEELGARLVVFDTLSRIRDASVSESSAEMSQLLEPVQELCKRQRCCGLLVHHTGKVKLDNASDIDIYDTIRGSSSIRATCRGSLILAAGENCYRLAVENGWGKLDLQVLLDANTLQWRLVGNWVGPQVDLSQKDRVLNYLNQVGSAQLNQIAEATNLPKRSLYEVLKRLQCDDLIEKRGDRQAAVYIRKAIQQIQQLNTVLNRQDVDRENISPSIQQPEVVGGTPKKVINEVKSDQNFDHFSERKTPPTNTEVLKKSPKSPSDKAFGIQQQFNTDSTRISENGSNVGTASDSSDDSENPKVINESPRVERWMRHVEFDTVVEVTRRGKSESTVKIPGVGRRRVSNDLLKAVDYDPEE